MLKLPTPPSRGILALSLCRSNLLDPWRSLCWLLRWHSDMALEQRRHCQAAVLAAWALCIAMAADICRSTDSRRKGRTVGDVYDFLSTLPHQHRKICSKNEVHKRIKKKQPPFHQVSSMMCHFLQFGTWFPKLTSQAQVDDTPLILSLGLN